jgi:hypothetical protein
MRHVQRLSGLVAALLIAPSIAAAQGPGDEVRPVADGGITVPGWMGRVDPKEAAAGGNTSQSRLSKEGEALHVMTGPALAYWNPSMQATGNYTVKATFREPHFIEPSDHPHPYGIFIAGTEMGTDQQSYLYCAAYGNGQFIVRGFGPAPFQANGRAVHGDVNAAVNKAAGKGQPVSQDIAVSVKGDKVECAINGTVVGSYDKAGLVGAGKLKSTDGVYGIRAAHNVEVFVTGLTMSKQ